MFYVIIHYLFIYEIHALYQPEAVESSGGMKLIRKSDVNIGAHVNTFFRTGIRIHDGSILGTTPSRFVNFNPCLASFRNVKIIKYCMNYSSVGRFSFKMPLFEE